MYQKAHKSNATRLFLLSWIAIDFGAIGILYNYFGNKFWSGYTILYWYDIICKKPLTYIPLSYVFQRDSILSRSRYMNETQPSWHRRHYHTYEKQIKSLLIIKTGIPSVKKIILLSCSSLFFLIGKMDTVDKYSKWLAHKKIVIKRWKAVDSIKHYVKRRPLV